MGINKGTAGLAVGLELAGSTAQSPLGYIAFPAGREYQVNVLFTILGLQNLM